MKRGLQNTPELHTVVYCYYENDLKCTVKAKLNQWELSELLKNPKILLVSVNAETPKYYKKRIKRK